MHATRPAARDLSDNTKEPCHSPVKSMTIVNAYSIDVEDYFQVSAFEKQISRAEWETLEHRIEANMDRSLALLEESDVHATFFTLGWIAERYPSIIRKIVSAGHELASHGYGHQRVGDLAPAAFRQDVTRTKGLLEDLAGVEICGYRAPSFSIGQHNLWALDVLAESGYKYSSSIYPGKRDHYGFPGAPRFMFRDRRSGMIEIPVTTAAFYSRLVPAAGGGFFRLYPYRLSHWLIERINRDEQQAVVFYTHPWEIDPLQPRQRNIGLKTRFRHYINLERTEQRLRRLLRDFRWGRMDDIFIGQREIPEYTLS